MKQQSPYIQAYEAGVKLATAQYFGKLANAEEERAMLMEQYETADSADQEAIAQQILELENNARREPAEAYYSYGPGEGNKVIDSDPQSTYLDDGYDLESLLSEPSTQGNMAATLGREQPSYLSSFLGGAIPTTQTPPITRNRPLTMAEKFTSPRQQPQITPNRAATPAEQVLQGATPQPQEPMGPPAELQNFQAVRGGYGKQLKALRRLSGLSRDNQDLLNQTNYRDLASVMGNRALMRGDQFNVQDLLGRLRGQQARRDQEAGGGGSIGSSAKPIQVQNRRGRNVNRFQTLGQQRNAANTKSNIRLPKMETDLRLASPSKFEGSAIPRTRLNKIQNQPVY